MNWKEVVFQRKDFSGVGPLSFSSLVGQILEDLGLNYGTMNYLDKENTKLVVHNVCEIEFSLPKESV